MQDSKNFPNDFTKEEIIKTLSELSTQIDTEILSEGARINIDRKIMVGQNHLVFLSLIESNLKLASQQEILINQQNLLVTQQDTLKKLLEENITTGNRTGKEAKFIILLTILTLIATSALEWFHMQEANENEKEIIQELKVLIQNTSSKDVLNYNDSSNNNKILKDSTLKKDGKSGK